MADKLLDELIKRHSAEFEGWQQSFRFHQEHLAPDEELIKKVTWNLNDFLDCLITFARSKDKWSIPYIDLYPFITEVYKSSLKTGSKYHFGLDCNGIYLEVHFHHARYLKNMNDNFWKEFIMLGEYGNFEFKENLGFSKEFTRKHQHLFKNFKGNLFRMMRNYFLAETYFEDSSDLGSLYVSWQIDDDFESTFKNACLAFKTLYKLNYQLWKVQSTNKMQDDLNNQK